MPKALPWARGACSANRGLMLWLAVLWLSQPASEALATSVRPMNLEELVAGADLIFLGQLIGMKSSALRGGLPVTDYEFQVLYLMEGHAGATVTVRQFGWPQVDTATGRVAALPGMPLYVPDGVYLLILNKESALGLRSPVGLGQGAFWVFEEPSPDGQTSTRAINAHGNAGLFRDARTLRRLVREPPERDLLRGEGTALLLDPLIGVIEKFLAERVPGRGGARRPPMIPLSAQLSLRQARAAATEEARQPAQGPLLVSGNGSPYVWNVPSATNPGGTLTAVPYHPDGDLFDPVLGNVNKATADALVASLFEAWTAAGQVPTTSIAFVQGGTLPVDCTSANITAAGCLPDFPDGFNPIIYDQDGSITRALFGAGAECSILGFAGPDFISTTAPHITESMAVLNGIWVDGQSNFAQCNRNTEMPLIPDFAGVFAHEFGHFFGLDHAQVNLSLFLNNANLVIGSTNYGVPPLQSIATMEPFAVGHDATSLEHDDLASVSRLYPALSFHNNFGTIRGTIFRPDGATPFDCANVIARELSDPFYKAVSGPSGDRGSTKFLGGPASLRGAYEIVGLPPGSYAVRVERIRSNFVRGSSVGPCDSSQPSLPGPEEFWNNAESASDNPADFTPIAISAGADLSGIHIILNTNPTADLSVSQSVALLPAIVQENLTYTITVTNHGPLTASGVSLTGTLSGSAIIQSVTPSQGSCSSVAIVNCNLGTLNNNASAQITLIVTPTASGTLTHTASVSSSLPDSNAANNSSTTSIAVSAVVDLSVTQEAAPDPATQGSPLIYTIRVTNHSSVTATAVTLRDTLPQNVEYDSASPNSCSQSNGLVTCSLGNLPGGSTLTLEITVIPLSQGEAQNHVNVGANEPDPNQTNNSLLITTSVNGPLCPGVTLFSSPAATQYTRKNQRKTITVRVTNGTAGALQVLGFTPLQGEAFLIQSVSPRLPKTLKPGASQLFRIRTKGPAVVPAAAAAPYFTTRLSCGVTAAARESLLVELSDWGVGTDSALAHLFLDDPVESLEVRVYDLRGRQVFRRSGRGARIPIDFQSLGERGLANGLYLALITLKGEDGRVWRREVKKLVVQR